ncbi:phage tail tape measure protein [uncultured Arthrobacter sp.]|uniref:phage tail tape measure protein n=1 Tax=uncultured Arthrobacter sp. TaxID=114050 RepID=UPI0025ECDAEB|nr:phage tail tape measure protein [uncultured Arthrobacter sp.]
MADRTVVYRLQADVQQFKAQMAAAGASVKKSAGDMTAATKDGEKFRAGLDSLGGAAGKVGLVAAAGLGAAVKSAADFDKAMSAVEAATHESAQGMEQLRAAALKAGAETAFSANEAAAGIENLAKAGVTTTEILDGGLTGALSLAAAGEMEVADAAEAAAGAMAQFGLEGEQVPHIADLLAAAAGKAQGEVSDMVYALKMGGTVAAQTGLTLEETTGTLAALAEQSLLGSDAGTSFKTMLASLTPNSKKARDAMELYNIQAFDAQGNFVGMTELAGQLESGLGDLTNEQRMMALETIFGSDAVRAASIIYDNGAEGIAKWTENVNDAGYAAETAAIKQDNLAGDIEKLGGALSTAFIGTGEGAQGPLRSLVQSLEKAVNAYNELGEGAKSGVGIALGATALLGGGLFVFSKVVQAVSNTRDALSNLGVTADSAKGKMSGFASFVGGPWGLAMIGATVILGDYMAQQSKTAGYVDTLTAALDDQSGAMTRQAIATNLNDEGWLEYAESIGVSSDVVIDAALGSAEAMEVLKAATAGEGGFWSADFTGDADQFIANVQAQTEAQKQAQKEAKLLAEANGKTGDSAAAAAPGVADLGSALLSAEEKAAEFKHTIEGLNAVLSGRAGLRDYEAALDDFTAGLKENGRTFDINTAKGRNNQAALDGIAGAALKVAQSLEGAARKKFLTNAIADIRTMGAKMGLPKAEIARLIELLRTANESDVNPNINVNTGPANASIAALEAHLRNIADEDVFVNVRHRQVGDTGIGPQNSLATGGPVYGPGTATSDSIPAYLSNGEYVIKAAAVDKYGTHMFDRLNAMHFADGGPVNKDKDWSRNGMQAVVIGQGSEVRDLISQFGGLKRAIEKHGKLLDRETKELEADRAEVERIGGLMENLASATTASFRTGLFDSQTEEIAGDSNIWGAGAQGPRTVTTGGWMQNLSTDIAGLQERATLQSALAAAGLTGPALEAALTEGSNADLSSLLASGGVSTFQSQYNQRQALIGTVGAAGAESVYGGQMKDAGAVFAEQKAELVEIKAELRMLNKEQRQREAAKERREAARARREERNADRTGEATAAALDGASTKAHRDKNKGPRK